jgi:hypothetical protein
MIFVHSNTRNPVMIFASDPRGQAGGDLPPGSRRALRLQKTEFCQEILT